MGRKHSARLGFRIGRLLSRRLRSLSQNDEAGLLFSTAPNIRAWALALGLLATGTCLGSWVKGDLTANDFEHLGDLRLLLVFFLVFLGLAAGYQALSESRSALSWRALTVGFLAMSIPFLLAFPVGSKDVFLYAFYGKMWGTHGSQPYLHPPSTHALDPWFAFISNAWWSSYPAAYGPLFLLQTRWLHWLAGSSLTATVAAYKLGNLVAILLCGGLIARTRHVTGLDDHTDPNRAWMLWLWCPLVLFESLAAAHNDVWMAVFLLAAVLAWLHGRWFFSALLACLSLWYKWYVVVLIPVWALWSIRRWGPLRFARCVAAAGGVFLASAVGVWVLLGDAALPMLARVAGFQNVRLLAPTELPPPLWLLFQVARVLGVFKSASGQALFDGTRVLLFAGGLGWVLWRRRGTPYNPLLFVEDTLLSLLLFFGFLVTMLWPWHLVPIIGLAIASGRRVLERAAATLHAIALLSYFLTFAVAAILCAAIYTALAILRRESPGESTWPSAPRR
jgi:hypothetical protein